MCSLQNLHKMLLRVSKNAVVVWPVIVSQQDEDHIKIKIASKIKLVQWVPLWGELIVAWESWQSLSKKQHGIAYIN